jgi:SAM-dependent methyltransferase
MPSHGSAWRAGPRVHRAELLDRADQDHGELSESLSQVSQVNRLFGGLRALRRHLERFLPAGTLRLLDVGTGNGDTAAELAAWAAARGARWTVTGLDHHAGVLAVARERERRRSGPRLVRADALDLPFRSRAFDVSFCTLTLHHFRDEDAVRLIAEMARVTRRTVLVNDLERGTLSYWSARLLSWTLWRRNRITRHDGPLSVLRSFTVAELLALGVQSPLQQPAVRRHFPFRLVLEGMPFGGGSGRPGEQVAAVSPPP